MTKVPKISNNPQNILLFLSIIFLYIFIYTHAYIHQSLKPSFLKAPISSTNHYHHQLRRNYNLQEHPIWTLNFITRFDGFTQAKVDTLNPYTLIIFYYHYFNLARGGAFWIISLVKTLPPSSFIQISPSVSLSLTHTHTLFSFICIYIPCQHTLWYVTTPAIVFHCPTPYYLHDLHNIDVGAHIF